jgi:hypothetical protein
MPGSGTVARPVVRRCVARLASDDLRCGKHRTCREMSRVQRCRASSMGMADPYAEDACLVRPRPPTTTGFPRNEGLSRCSTNAKKHCNRGIELQPIVGDYGIQTVAAREDCLPGCRCRETAGQEIGDPLSDATIRDHTKRRVAEARQDLLLHCGLEPRPGCRSKIMSRGQPQLNPLMQTHFPTTWVMPGPSGQRELNFRLTTLGINQSHLGFAVLSPLSAR